MIQWTPTLSTGVSLLDEHHQEIFQLLAEIESAAQDDRTLFGVYALTRLKQFVQAHFSAEENLMKAAGYPGLAEHAAEHAKFTVTLRELQLKSIGQDISRDAVTLLTDWLTDHISKTDTEYAPYLTKLDVS